MNLDPAVWECDEGTYIRDGIINQMDPANVTVDGTGIHIRADLQADGRYHSAMITTRGRWSFLYGYLEADVTIPAGKGFWISLFGVAYTWPPEIDVFEYIGDGKAWLTSHLGPPPLVSQLAYPRNLSGRHVVGIDWTADQIIWYLDGVDVFRTRANIPQVPLFLYIMFAVGGWPGPPDDTTPLPAYYDIHRVRVWQRND